MVDFMPRLCAVCPQKVCFNKVGLLAPRSLFLHNYKRRKGPYQVCLIEDERLSQMILICKYAK